MPEAVYRMLTLLCSLVVACRRGTNLGLLRLPRPRAFVRADPTDPSPHTHERRLVGEAVRRCAADEVLVLDAGFGVPLLQEAGATRYVVRLAKNATFRRATPPPYRGRG